MRHRCANPRRRGRRCALTHPGCHAEVVGTRVYVLLLGSLRGRRRSRELSQDDGREAAVHLFRIMELLDELAILAHDWRYFISAAKATTRSAVASVPYICQRRSRAANIVIVDLLMLPLILPSAVGTSGQ